MSLLHTISIAALVAAAVSTAAAAQTAPPQALEGKFRGGYVCAKLPTTRGVLRAPLDLVIRDGKVQLARPLFNLDGTRFLGTELGSGGIDADGRLHVTSTWTYLGNTARGEYSGTLTPHGGTLTGTQTWQGPDGTGSLTRPCAAAVVPSRG